MNDMKNSGFTPLEVFNFIRDTTKGSRRRIRFHRDLNSLRLAELLTGFSMLELVVVIAIMVTVSSIVLANYPGFNERLTARQRAEEIASNVRQAQAYGLGVKEFVPNDFPGYGVYFESSVTDSYVLFADSVRNLTYDLLSSEKIKDLPILGNVRIYDLCANQKQLPAGSCGLTSLTVVYTRPTPIVILKGGSSPSCAGVGGSWCDIEVKIRGSRGTTRTVVIWLSGQISVE